MAPTAAKKGTVKKEETPLTAVVIADSFDQRFSPVLQSVGCFSALPLCNVPIIHYTLSWLMRTEIENIMLVVSAVGAKYIKSIEQHWNSSFDQITVVVCESAHSVGDCMRELHARELLHNDFLLISNPATVTSSTLETQIANFRKRRSENADNVMTLIYGWAENREKAVIGIEKATNKLLLYHAANNPQQLEIDKPQFYAEAEIRRDIVDCGISLCSRMIVTQFSDNFDFQQRDDVIREILSKDDILGLNIHIDVMSSEEAAYSATDYESLVTLSSLLMERWFFPITPDRTLTDRFFAVCPHNVYLEETEETIGRLSSRIVPSSVEYNVSIGKLCQISPTAEISNASLGSNCSIGDKSRLTKCIVGNDCKIGANCVIEDAVLGDGCTLPDGSVVKGEAVLGCKVTYPSINDFPPKSAVCIIAVDEDVLEKIVSRQHGDITLAVHFWQMRNGMSFWRIGGKPKSSEGSDDQEEDESDTDESEVDNGIEDNVRQFYEEVLESMERVLEMEDQQMRNLILEINSSKLACNVSMDDVSKNVFAAFLVLPGNKDISALKTLINKWKPLFLNYYKVSESQMSGKTATQRTQELDIKKRCQIQMLLAIEDKFDLDGEAYGRLAQNLIIFLYRDADVLDQEAILEWADSIDEDADLKALMKPIVEWLQESDDEDEEDDE